MFLITDLLFLDSSQFQYNPDYKVSRSLSTESYIPTDAVAWLL